MKYQITSVGYQTSINIQVASLKARATYALVTCLILGT